MMDSVKIHIGMSMVSSLRDGRRNCKHKSQLVRRKLIWNLMPVKPSKVKRIIEDPSTSLLDRFVRMEINSFLIVAIEVTLMAMERGFLAINYFVRIMFRMKETRYRERK